MTSYEPHFWTTIATFCRELAPISGPLLNSISQTADAIHRADYELRLLRPQIDLKRNTVLTPKDDEDLE